MQIIWKATSFVIIGEIWKERKEHMFEPEERCAVFEYIINILLNVVMFESILGSSLANFHKDCAPLCIFFNVLST